MGIGQDKVQVAKYESSSGGGSEEDMGVYGNSDPIHPQEDAIESAGGYVNDADNRDETVGWHRTNGLFYQFDADHAYPGIPIGQGGFDVDTILTSEDGAVLVNEDGNVLVSGG
jgi:hypothetical protein